MNFEKEFSNKEKELLKEAGIMVENRNYTADEILRCREKIAEHIMFQGKKDIVKIENQFMGILHKL